MRESVAIYDMLTLELCRLMIADKRKQGLTHLPCWDASGQAFRQTLYRYLALFSLDFLGLKCYSIRRGGATFEFGTHGLMEKTLIRGRWASTGVARLYITDAMAQLSSLQLTPKLRGQLHEASRVFLTLENDRQRSGKRGRDK